MTDLGGDNPPSIEQGLQPEARPPRRVVENKFRRVKIGVAYFGGGPERPKPVHSSTGPMEAAEVSATLTSFVRPDCFADALRTLLSDHVVCLEGAAGLGRRTGALALLHKVAPGDLYLMQPATTLEELRTFDYRRGMGYLMADHVSNEVGAEADFRWRMTCVAVRRAEAYLAVTRTGVPDYVRPVPWERPDKLELLRELLAELAERDAVAAALSEQVPEDWTLTSIAECAKLLRQKPDAIDEALAVFDVATVREVGAWFEQEPEPEPREIIEITALAFGWAANERRLENLAIQLEATLRHFLPPPQRPAGTWDADPGAALPMRRKARRSGTGLIQARQLHCGPTPSRVLVFKSKQHWFHVISELYGRCEAPYWDAVRHWLVDMVADDMSGGDLAAVAQGLALLAKVDFDEVLTFLEPLSSGDAGTNGVDCAAATLQLMAQEEVLAPAALYTAIRWLTAGSVNQRLSAGEALVGELGLRFPVEAARRLWQLITQDQELSKLAVATPALFFANLVDSGRDATEILDLIAEKVERFGKVGTAPDLVDLTMNVALHLLSSLDNQGVRRAAFELLGAYPESAEAMARIWAGVLRVRPYRLRALEIMWDGLHASRDRPRDGAILGDALGRALRPNELTGFIEGLAVAEKRRRHRDKTHGEPIAHLVIQALKRRHRQESTKDQT